MDTVFSRIIAKEIPATWLYEDDLCVVILDIAPVVKGHALIITKTPYPTLAECPSSVLSHMMDIAKALDAVMRKKLGADATNIIINNGPAAGQEIPHLHIHVIPRFFSDGKRIIPHKETYEEHEMERYGELLHLD